MNLYSIIKPPCPCACSNDKTGLFKIATKASHFVCIRLTICRKRRRINILFYDPRKENRYIRQKWWPLHFFHPISAQLSLVPGHARFDPLSLWKMELGFPRYCRKLRRSEKEPNHIQLRKKIMWAKAHYYVLPSGDEWSVEIWHRLSFWDELFS